MFVDGFIHEPDALLALSKLHGGLSAGNTSGQVFFVDSTDGEGADSGGYGTFFNPFLTLAYALTASELAAGDTIILKPGHTESFATAVEISTAGVTVWGQGKTTLRPTLTFTATGAYLGMTAAGCSIVNCILQFAQTSHGKLVYLDEAGCGVHNCKLGRSGNFTSTSLIQVNGKADCVISGNQVAIQDSTGALADAIRLTGACHRTAILRNYLSGNYSTAIINAITAASNDLLIERNTLINTQTTNIAGIIDLVASCTGIIADNRGKHGYVTNLTTTIDGASAGSIENYIQNTDGESGGITPPTRST